MFCNHFVLSLFLFLFLERQAGETALMTAVLWGERRVIEALISHGADIYIQNKV
jgi:ankyrin repeat protein